MVGLALIKGRREGGREGGMERIGMCFVICAL